MSGESFKAMESAGSTPEREPGFYPFTMHDLDQGVSKTSIAELRREEDGSLLWHFIDSPSSGFAEDYLRHFDAELKVGERIKVTP